MTEITGEGTLNKTKLLIYEDSAFNKIAFENILHDQMKLKHQTKFFQNGLQIAETIRSLHMEREKNCVALVIMDYNMPGMNGIQLIRWVRDYFLNHAIPFKELPVFAFRVQQFYELAPDIIAQLNELGVKKEEVIDKITNVKQMDQYFRKIGYLYRTIAQN